MKQQILILSVVAVLLLTLSFLSIASALTIEAVDIYPKEIAPGETATIEITIENNFDENIEDVSVSLDFSDPELPFAPYDSSNEQSFQEIKEDRSKTANFEIIALTNAKSGIYKIPVKISYFEGDETEHKKDSLIIVTVNSKPILDVEREDGLLLKGQNNEVTLRIINKGLSDVKFSEIELGSSAHYTILSQKKVYIGDIDSDDFDSVDFKLFFNEKVPTKISLPVTLTYRDVTNKKYIEDYNPELRVYSGEKALELGLIQQSRTSYIIGAVVVVIILWFIYRKIKKRRKRKKAEAGGGR